LINIVDNDTVLGIPKLFAILKSKRKILDYWKNGFWYYLLMLYLATPQAGSADVSGWPLNRHKIGLLEKKLIRILLLLYTYLKMLKFFFPKFRRKKNYQIIT